MLRFAAQLLVTSALAELIRSTRAPTKDRLIGKIMGGNPAFRGTRVPVHMLAELVTSRVRARTRYRRGSVTGTIDGRHLPTQLMPLRLPQPRRPPTGRFRHRLLRQIPKQFAIARHRPAPPQTSHAIAPPQLAATPSAPKMRERFTGSEEAAKQLQQPNPALLRKLRRQPLDQRRETGVDKKQPVGGMVKVKYIGSSGRALASSESDISIWWTHFSEKRS